MTADQPGGRLDGGPPTLLSIANELSTLATVVGTALSGPAADEVRRRIEDLARRAHEASFWPALGPGDVEQVLASPDDPDGDVRLTPSGIEKARLVLGLVAEETPPPAHADPPGAEPEAGGREAGTAPADEGGDGGPIVLLAGLGSRPVPDVAGLMRSIPRGGAVVLLAPAERPREDVSGFVARVREQIEGAPAAD